MKGSQVVTAIAGVVLVGAIAAMALTNPGEDKYQDYAVAKLNDSRENLCPQTAKILGQVISTQKECQAFIAANRPAIARLIATTTERQNSILFSIYRTDLSVGKVVPLLPDLPIPAYHFETIGVFGNFFTYEIEER
jgi:hypothetical protein